MKRIALIALCVSTNCFPVTAKESRRDARCTQEFPKDSVEDSVKDQKIANERPKDPKSAPASMQDFLKDMSLFGSLSLNYRNISPQRPGYEAQVQHEMYLTDIYFGVNGRLHRQYPFIVEFQAPSSSQGSLSLYRFSVRFNYKDHWKSELGKLLVPFGYYNELYRGEQFLSVTSPLLYASPDSLDAVLRLNSPHPPMTKGLTDIGARVSYYPNSETRWVPSEITGYVVNGFGEVNNRSRTFPYTGSLSVAGVPISGVSRDWGHMNNNLADNNNSKVPGARIAFALGDFKVPSPVNEGLNLEGIRIGFSGMQGNYDLEDAINGQSYTILGTDFEAQLYRIGIHAEYVYSAEKFRRAQADAAGNVDFTQSTDQLGSRKEVNKGYYVQLSAPLISKPRWGEQVLGLVAVNRLERYGPRLAYSANKDPDSKMPVEAFASAQDFIATRINKYTGGLNYRINGNFTIKGEYSYWDIKVPEVSGATQKSISQTALSFVFNF